MHIMCVIFLTFCPVVSVYASRAVFNTTDIMLYAAGYHAGAFAERQTTPQEIAPDTAVDLDVPTPPKIFSTKKRYIVIARTREELAQSLPLQMLKMLPHINITSVFTKIEGDYYVVDKDGRLAVYNGIEYSRLGQWAKTKAKEIKQEFTEAAIDTASLPAVRNNRYRSNVASVRQGKSLSAEEKMFLDRRTPKVRGALSRLLQKPFAPGSKVPKIAIVLSGGGNRAMFTACGFIQGLQELGILDATTYIASLSGSTWFLGSWYASGLRQISEFRKKLVNKMKRGITNVSSQEFSLMLDAFKLKYAYHEPITSMDLFGALLGNVLLDDFGDERYNVYLSDQKDRIAYGEWPMPLYTAVDGSKMTHKLDRWYEFTPYEVGGVWLNYYAPTWAFGRRFAQGRSVSDQPEVSLAFLFGLFGSAFAVDVYRAWQEVEKVASPKANVQTIVEKTILNQIGDKRLTQCEEFNFTAGLPGSPLRDQKYMIFVDGGFASGLPYPVVGGERPERIADIMIFFEMSENVAKIKDDVKGASTGLYYAESYARTHNLPFPTIFSVEPQMVTVYKDDRNPATTPVVVWMPCMMESEKWERLSAIDTRFAGIKDFDIAMCADSFCASVNFAYAPEQAEKMMTLGQFCAHACKDEIIEAIAWKVAQLSGN